MFSGYRARRCLAVFLGTGCLITCMPHTPGSSCHLTVFFVFLFLILDPPHREMLPPRPATRRALDSVARTCLGVFFPSGLSEGSSQRTRDGTPAGGKIPGPMAPLRRGGHRWVKEKRTALTAALQHAAGSRMEGRGFSRIVVFKTVAVKRCTHWLFPERVEGSFFFLPLCGGDCQERGRECRGGTGNFAVVFFRASSHKYVASFSLLSKGASEATPE